MMFKLMRVYPRPVFWLTNRYKLVNLDLTNHYLPSGPSHGEINLMIESKTAKGARGETLAG
jgi:hypothetical protein